MDDRARWHTLQNHLANARASLKAGEFDRALEHVEAALGIDPESPAGRDALRERIVATDTPPDGQLTEEPLPLHQPAPSFGVSSEGFARFEQRARQRRVERQLAVARDAILSGDLSAARAAMSEVRTLDAGNAGLISLDSDLEVAERTTRILPRGTWIVAAAVFGGIVFGASWLENDTKLLAVSHVPTAIPRLSETIFVVGTAAKREAERPVARPDTVQADAPVHHPPQVTPIQSSLPINISNAISNVIDADGPPPSAVQLLPMLPAPSPPAAGEPPPVAISDIVQPAAPGERVISHDDDQLVRETLQRYRVAYEGLDARSAQSVWPRVDETALRRAFGDLESQRLTFEDCNVQIHGVIATAMCRGSASYTPKFGSREPRVEPRTWNFTLRKVDAGWQIDTARVDR